MNINSENCELLAKISKLSRINSYFETEIIRYQMIVKYYEKLFEIFENIRNKFDFNENYNDFEEILLKRKLNELKTIKPLDIELNKDLITVKSNNHLIIETESDFDINDNNFDTNSVNSDETENNSQLNDRKRVDTSVGKTLEEPQNQTKQSNDRNTSEVKTLKTYGKINRILIEEKYEDIVDTNIYQSLKERINTKKHIQLGSDLLDEDINQNNGKINVELEMIKNETLDDFPDESVSNEFQIPINEVNDQHIDETNDINTDNINPEFNPILRKEVYRCGVSRCNHIYGNVEELKAHMKTHNTYKPIVANCGHKGCEKSFTGWDRFRHLRAHQMLKHPELFPNSPTFHCKFIGCNYKAKRISFLNKHMKYHKTHKYFCKFENCSKFFHSAVYLKAHYERHSLMLNTNNINLKASNKSLKLYVCEQKGCDQRFSDYYNLSIHLKSHQKCVKKQINENIEDSDDINLNEDISMNNTVSNDGSVTNNTFDKSNICEYCDKKYAHIKSLVRHRLIHEKRKIVDSNDSNDCDNNSLNEKRFVCETCNKAFHERFKLKWHQNTHLKVKPFLCEHIGCGKSMSSRNALKRHSNIHKIDNKLICDWPECDFHTNNKFSFEDHINHHKGVNVVCDWPECDYKTWSRRTLHIHRLKHKRLTDDSIGSVNKKLKSIDSNGKVMYICDQNSCKYTTITEKGMNYHQMNKHPEMFPNLKPHKCTFDGCEYETLFNNHYSKHLDKHKQRKYFCKFQDCYRFFSNENLLNTHIRAKHESALDGNEISIQSIDVNNSGPLTVSCHWPGCEKKFNNNYRLKMHMSSHTGEKLFSCSWPGCEKQFCTQRSQSMHINSIHKQEFRFVCEWPGCEYRTNKKRNLIKHINIHKDERKYFCDYPDCQYKANNIEAIRGHKKTHLKMEMKAKGMDTSGFRKILCHWEGCNKRFFQNTDLADHMNVHTGKTPHVCDYKGCGKGFAHRNTLKVHKQTHTKEYRFVCDWPECDYKTYFKACFESHKGKHKAK